MPISLTANRFQTFRPIGYPALGGLREAKYDDSKKCGPLPFYLLNARSSLSLQRDAARGGGGR
jgi:hypothetical protein